MRKLYFRLKIIQYLHTSNKRETIFKLNDFINEYKNADSNNLKKEIKNLTIAKDVYNLLSYACYISHLLSIESLKFKFNLKKTALQKIVQKVDNIFSLKYYQLFKKLFDIMFEELLIVESIFIIRYPELRALKKFNFPRLEKKARKSNYLYDLAIDQFK